MTNIDISPEAVEHLCAIHEGYEQHGTVATLRALSAALTQSRAETAAAYERAAMVLNGEAAVLEADASRFRSGTDPHHYRMNFAAAARKQSATIRAIATPDQTAALDRLIAEAVADKDAEIEQLNQDLSDMRDNAESAYRRGYWAGGNGA